jgi:glutamyl-tRNA synthetase
MSIRTRFAPSPTGFLHIGGARTALFSWAYARRHAGKFILRVEDTDLERSTAESVDAILESMKWLGIDWDEGPFFQMQRLARYKEVADELIAKGSRVPLLGDEGGNRRAPRRAARERIEAALRRALASRAGARSGARCAAGPPAGDPLSHAGGGQRRLERPREGADRISERELDDLVLLRADGVPTYNFGVVVDDIDMQMTHVIRGDDHVNNTPRQIHIFRALDAHLPEFAHVPMILGADGERLSKRHGAVSVTQYRDEGYLPEAMVNYLARLGWSHGDEEIFPVGRFVEWFDLAHVSRSPAQFNPEKLAWLNQQYLKPADDARLAGLTEPVLRAMGVDTASGPPLEKVVALLKDRAATIVQLADAAVLFYRYDAPAPEKVAEMVTERIRTAVGLLAAELAQAAWDRKSLSAAISGVLKSSGLKMPELAMPVRLLVTGRTQTPSLDAVLELLGRDTVLARLKKIRRPHVSDIDRIDTRLCSACRARTDAAGRMGVHQHDELARAPAAADDDHEAVRHEPAGRRPGGMAASAESDCKVTPKGRSGESVSWDIACPKSGMNGSGTARLGQGTIESETKMTMSGQGQNFEMTTKTKGRLLGPCK